MSSSWWERKLNAPAANPQRTQLPPAVPPAPPRLQPMPQQTPQNAVHMQVTDDNFVEATQMWQGGEGTRKETTNCPQCGSDLYFSRSNSGSVVSNVGMATPAPRCYSCGYTEGRQMQGLPPA